MKKLIRWTLSGLLLFTLSASQAQARKVIAKVVRMKGNVSALFPGAQAAKALKKGDPIPEDTSILTGENSFARLKFVDGSSSSVGASSKIVVMRGGTKETTLVGLLKGRLRSNIRKAESRKKKNKLKKGTHVFIVKSRNASIGVRGTDFLSIHNTANKVTSLMTFGGSVGIAKIRRDFLLPDVKKRILGKMTRTDYDAILNSKDAEIVKKGRYSGVVPAHEFATIPVRVSPVQYTTLKKNVDLDFTKKGEIIDETKVSAEEVYGKEEIGDPPAQGFYDKETGSFAPRSGGILDIQTGLYVQPEPNAELDKKFQVYKLSKEYGGVDGTTGDYTPPDGLELNAVKGFQVKDMSDKEQVDTAISIFGLERDKEFAGKVKKKLKKSLTQVLNVKKAVLNNEIREDILRDDFGEEGEYDDVAKEFTDALKSIHEVLDLDILIKTTYSDKLVEKFMEETINNKDKSNWALDLNFAISHNSYLTSNWIAVPKLHLLFHLYPGQSDPWLDDAESFGFALGVENTVKHKIGFIPADLILDFNVEKTNKLNQNHDSYETIYSNDAESRGKDTSLYLQKLNFKFLERIKIGKWQFFQIGAKQVHFDSFSSFLNGKSTSYNVGYGARFLPRFEIKLLGIKEDRDTKKDLLNSKSTNMRAEFNIYNIANYYTFFSNFTSRVTTFSDSTISKLRGEEKYKIFNVAIKRELLDELFIKFDFGTEEKTSLDEEADYKVKKFGLGVNYVY
jgi:DNA-binding ferritin-like protein